MKLLRGLGMVFLWIVLAAVTMFVSGCGAGLGASVAGMAEVRSGGWGLEPLVYWIGGALGGGFLFIVLTAVLPPWLDYKYGTDRGSSVMLAAGIVILLAFPGGFAGYKISEVNARKNAIRNREEARLSAERREVFHSQLQNDPAVAARERWFVAPDERRGVYVRSLSDPGIAYDTKTIGELYAMDYLNPERLLAHPAFDAALLETKFHRSFKIFTRQRREDGDLSAILLNPNAKREWLDAVGHPKS